MLELFALNSSVKGTSDGDSSTPSTVALVFAVLLWIALLVWAISRALKCSKANPDSRALHFLFCLSSPSLYLVCSYAVPDFCIN